MMAQFRGVGLHGHLKQCPAARRSAKRRSLLCHLCRDCSRWRGGCTPCIESALALLLQLSELDWCSGRRRACVLSRRRSIRWAVLAGAAAFAAGVRHLLQQTLRKLLGLPWGRGFHHRRRWRRLVETRPQPRTVCMGSCMPCFWTILNIHNIQNQSVPLSKTGRRWRNQCIFNGCLGNLQASDAQGRRHTVAMTTATHIQTLEYITIKKKGKLCIFNLHISIKSFFSMWVKPETSHMDWWFTPVYIPPINMAMRGLDAPDKMKIFSSSMQWIIEASQWFVNIDSLKWPKNAIRTAPKTWFYCYLHPVVSKTLFFPSNFLHPPFFQLRGQKCRTSSCRHCQSTLYIYIYVCMYVCIYWLICCAEQIMHHDEECTA